jgi:hypothetical protein
MSFISISDCLLQINDTTGNTLATNYFKDIIPDVEDYVFDKINRYSTGFTTTTGSTTLELFPNRLKRAMVFLAGHWFSNRESVAPIQMYRVPETFDALIESSINYGEKY